MKDKELAILGGHPTREAPFCVQPLVDKREEELVLKAIKEKNFSRYIGSMPEDKERIFTLNSIDALSIDAEWHFLGGPNIRKFSHDFASYFNVKYAIPINSATSGISVSVAALGLSDNDEIIIPGLSYTASGTAPLLFNVIPVFVDVDKRTFCIDPKKIIEAITPKTKAIICVHLLGNICNMNQIKLIAKKYNLHIIEDVAQAPGAKYEKNLAGTIGDVGIFSFQQSKNIMTGEGGMIITNNDKIAKKCRLILNHGEACMDEKSSINDLINNVGCNFRMTELSAALGIAQLEKLDIVNEWRNKNAQYLISKLSKFDFLEPPFIESEVEPIFHILAFKFKEKKINFSRDIFIAALRAEGIPVGTGYTRGMYENPIFLKKIAYGKNSYPWNSINGKSEIIYTSNQCEVINSLIKKEFLWFYHIAHPSTIKDMDDIVKAIEKIYINRDKLVQNYERILKSGDISLKQGRI